MPSKRDYKDKDGNKDLVAFKMAVFAWKEDYKAMRVRKDKYRDNESNAWALIYIQCSPELKNKLEGAEGVCISGLRLWMGHCNALDTNL
jgi:hypothetical protein